MPFLVMKIIALFLLSCAWLLAAEGPYRAKFIEVAESDPIYRTLTTWKEKVTNKYSKSGYSRPEFGSWSEIPSESLKSLFPEFRFFTIHWNEVPIKERKNEEPASRAYGLYIMLACRIDREEWTELFGYGNYEEYGRLLARERVTLNTDEQARMIWDGFCDLHQKHWRNQGFERKSDTVWHLGMTIIDDVYYYYRVDVDTAGKVQAAKLHADKLKPSADRK